MRNLVLVISMLAFFPVIPAMGQMPQTAQASSRAKVISTMNSGGYTYVEYDDNGQKKWLAGTEIKLNKGDTVEYSGGMPMTNFESKTLKRTFPTILFVSSLAVAGAPNKAPSAPSTAAPAAAVATNPHAQTPAEATKIQPGSIPLATGGLRVADCLTKKNELKGKNVTVRGKVVKFNANILGKNWIHIQDGSGTGSAADITVTTTPAAMTAIGKVVLVSGKLVTDKDFGSGYKYDVMIEEAKIEEK